MMIIFLEPLYIFVGIWVENHATQYYIQQKQKKSFLNIAPHLDTGSSY